MKRKVNVLLILGILIIALTGCKEEEKINKESLKADTLIEKDLNGLAAEDLNHYEIDVILDEKEKSYTGKQKTTFKNETGEPLKEIYFRLYPNAFKSFKDSPIVLSHTPYSEESYKSGYIDIEKISVNDEELKYDIEGIDGTVLKIELKEPLMEGSFISLDMEYSVKLPTSQDRFGYGENTINFGNWYPVLSVYDEDGWSRDPYYAVGDPFYTDISNYDVNIRVDKDLVVASSGNILEEKIEDGEKIYKIEGRMIRDFAFAVSRDFKISEEKIDGTVVKLYYLEEKEELIKEALKYSVDSIKTFNKAFGKYPYGSYSVVLTEFPSGMEYPGVVFIGKQFFHKRALEYLEQVIVHETAHQWWYGIVGNDEVKEAWLDEGLTSYSEVIYMDKVYGEEKGDAYFDYNIETGYDITKKYLKGDNNIINKPLDQFKDWDDYSLLVYTKSAMFLRDIEETYSKDILLEILSEYFKENKYKNARTEDFSNAFEKITGDSFKEMKERWLN